MGVYIYKVSSKPCMKYDGEPVYEATYAYKPYWMGMDAEKINKELDFRSGVVACQRWWAKKTPQERTNVLVKHYNEIIRVPYVDGAVYDSAFDRKPVHTIPESGNPPLV